MWWMIPVLLIGFGLVHLCKMLRLYLVLMEHKIGFGKFIRMYFGTTFINLIIPFKLGELYRFIRITGLTKVWQVGILSVLIDRIFDMVALLIVLIPFDLLYHGVLTMVTFLLLLVILLFVIIYLSILPTYEYLNHYIIRHKTSKRALLALKVLDVIKAWYDFTRNLITGRSVLITLASLAGWVFEVAVLKVFSMYLGLQFGMGDFSEYIRAIFSGETNELLKKYTCVGAAIMLAVTGILYLAYGVKRGRRKTV